MILIRLKVNNCLAIPLILALALGDATAASPTQSAQSVHVDGVDTPVELPVAMPPIKNIALKPPKPTEQELRTRAETGNVAAMEAYAYALPFNANFPWLLKAAEGGSPKAMMIVANRAKSGATGHGIDQALSDKWLNKALQTGSQALSRKDIKVLKLLLDGDQYGGAGLFSAATKAQYALAIGRARGFENEDTLMTWYERAEQIATGLAGSTLDYDGTAAIKIGILYEKGLGVSQSSTTAISWYEKAVDDTIKYSMAKPLELMKLLNSVQLPKESIDHVITFIRSAAETGNAQAQYYLGEMYYEGKYMPQSYSDATGWFEKCDNSNDNDAGGWRYACVRTLGNMYLRGQGVSHDPVKAAFYYQRLFDLGANDWANPHAEDILLPMYCGGEGIPVNKPKAFAVFKKVADQGVPFDELGVGAMYQMGWGYSKTLQKPSIGIAKSQPTRTIAASRPRPI